MTIVLAMKNIIAVALLLGLAGTSPNTRSIGLGIIRFSGERSNEQQHGAFSQAFREYPEAGAWRNYTRSNQGVN
jgi:hypothetical protein